MERASERARKRKKLPERRKERKERDGRAKNRQRPGRKEGAENEGELRSASESLEASRSALSRWISSGQHRSLSFSLSPSFWLALRPPLSLGHEGGEDRSSPLSPLRFRARSGTTVPPPHHFMAGCRVPRVYPRGHLSRTTIGMNVKRRKGKTASFFFFHVARTRAFTRGPTETIPAYTYIHILICIYMYKGVCMHACMQPGR